MCVSTVDVTALSIAEFIFLLSEHTGECSSDIPSRHVDIDG